MAFRSIKKILDKKKETILKKRGLDGNVVRIVDKFFKQKEKSFGLFNNILCDYNIKSNSLTISAPSKILANEIGLERYNLEQQLIKEGIKAVRIVIK